MALSPSQDSATYYSDTEANPHPPPTVREVMAEQISHHVVTNSESASGSPLVDIAANHTTTAPAGSGIETNALGKQAQNEVASAANANLSSVGANAEALEHAAAEPSAGDAATKNTNATLVRPVMTAEEDIEAGQIELVNGIHDAMQADGLPDDVTTPDISVDLNSDTDASRGDAPEPNKETNRHVRANSVKRPTTYSKVSVTKNFLAKSASATAPAAPTPNAKQTLSVGTAQPPAARPRLVAKTGPSIRDIQKAREAASSPGGPDANKVWNKNRPAPPAPPKQFTDEELKQQYGIHLATRLQSDENGKEAKWADIDDEDDDWAPVAVEWMDGTKSTLTPAEATPVQKDQQLLAPQSAKPADGVKPSLSVMKKPADPGPPKTILRPGAAAQAKQNGAGSPSPGPQKATLTAKSPAPAPAKSPWAPVPKPESILPINPPVQQPSQHPPFASQDARTYEQAPAIMAQTTREIAADTFDRSWREGEGERRELFNSVNGRYEPAPERRRSSVKPDAYARKPSVLQRPSQSGPAEPSAAFQTRSSGQEGAPFGHRRGSSVSQGSLPPARRPSISRPSELSHAPEMRPSVVIGHDMHASPRSARSELAKPNFDQQSPWDQQLPPQPEGNAEPAEDPVQVQERIMKEKREVARKRRQDEEAREETARKERLAAKMASLAGAGKSRKEREAEAAAAATAPKTERPTEPSALTEIAKTAPAEVAEKSTEMTAEAAPYVETQPPQPAPPSAEVELHSPEDLQLPSPISQAQEPGLPLRPSSSADQGQRQAPRTHLSSRDNARAPFQQQPSPYRPPPSSYSSPGERKQQPFGRSPIANNDAFSTWGTASNGNVWGNSGIGNGTFQSADSFAPVPGLGQGSLPPPPGMGRPSTSTRISPQFGQDARPPSLQQSPLPEQPRTFPPPGFDARADQPKGQPRANGYPANQGMNRQAHLPRPIAPPSRARQQPSVQRLDPVSAWNNAAQSLPNQYTSNAQAAERMDLQEAPAEPSNNTFKETFKQISVNQGRLGGPRKFDKTEYTIHGDQGSRSVQTLSPAPPNAQTQPSAPPLMVLPHKENKTTGENTVRIPDGSLNPAHGGTPVQQPPIAPPGFQQPQPLFAPHQNNVNFRAGPLPPISASKEQSPPPPETSSHSVNSGDARSPHVKLPPPPPVVRLPPPPAQHSMQPSSVMMPGRPISNWGPPGASKPLVMSEAWQARFNGLFNRTPIQTETPPSPPKTPPKMHSPALAVAASSRVVMDDLPHMVSATVSLPQARKVKSAEGFTIDDGSEVTSKPTMEQMFSEELSFGSLPRIRLPRSQAYGTGYSEDSNMPANGSNLALPKAVEAQSCLESDKYFYKHPRDYFLKLHGTKLQNKLVAHKPVNAPTGPHLRQERKHSGRFNRGKASAAGDTARESAPQSPVSSAPNGAPRGTPNLASRKTSFQHKAQTPTPAAGVAGEGANKNLPAAAGSPAGGEKRESKWARPPKGRNQARAIKTT